jgi:hypothetical protein
MMQCPGVRDGLDVYAQSPGVGDGPNDVWALGMDLILTPNVQVLEMD